VIGGDTLVKVDAGVARLTRAVRWRGPVEVEGSQFAVVGPDVYVFDNPPEDAESAVEAGRFRRVRV
jgi:hypothetical protein